MQLLTALIEQTNKAKGMPTLRQADDIHSWADNVMYIAHRQTHAMYVASQQSQNYSNQPPLSHALVLSRKILTTVSRHCRTVLGTMIE